ncbi:glycosyltransferase [Friedmanniella luteola]|nr:glycosyltransferase [Friedmanniella luteola]
MAATLEELHPDDVQVRVLDTRGLGSSPWSSVLPLLRSCLVLLGLAARGEVDVAHVNVSSCGSAIRKGLVVRTCRLARVPVVLHLHASNFPAFFGSLPGGSQNWVRTTFRLAVRVVVLGQAGRSYVEDVLAVAPADVTVLANATGPAATRGSARPPGTPLRILFLGRLGARKGVPELLRALADPRLRDRPWRAVLAGDGDVAAFRARAAELGLQGRVEFPGWVGRDAVARYLAAAHLVVLPSHAEGMPLSVLEAFAAGVPVVCTPVGSLPEIAVDGVNSLLVPVGEAGSLAEAILRLAEDEDLRARLGTAALTTWGRGHTIADYALRLTREWRAVARVVPVTDDAGARAPVRPARQ